MDDIATSLARQGILRDGSVTQTKPIDHAAQKQSKTVNEALSSVLGSSTARPGEMKSPITLSTAGPDQQFKSITEVSLNKVRRTIIRGKLTRE